MSVAFEIQKSFSQKNLVDDAELNPSKEAEKAEPEEPDQENCQVEDNQCDSHTVIEHPELGKIKNIQ